MAGWICAVVLAGLSLLLAGLLIWQRQKNRRRMQRLLEMLDAAMDGTFTERDYDESLLSAVESKMNVYLSASQVSARNLASEKDKIKELISDISHQTKTPLANILLYAQLLDEQPLPKESRPCVAALGTQAEKLNFLIAALVKISQLESGILELYPEENRVQPLLREIQSQYASKARQKSLALSVEDTEEIAVFDPKWTAEVLANLVDNAVKYTPDGGSIAVSVSAYEVFCRIDVQDTGRGVPEEEQAKIFTRFYRSPAVSQQEGVGIGLYLARQILAQQGGYIKVVSDVGKGSLFSVFLPRPV